MGRRFTTAVVVGMLVHLAAALGTIAENSSAKSDFEVRLDEAEALNDDGYYERAEEMTRGIVADIEAAAHRDTHVRSRGLDMLTGIMLNNGKAWYPETLETAERALDVAKKMKKNDPERIGSLSNRAMIHLHFDEDEEAVRLYRRALEIAEKDHGEAHEDIVGPLLRLAGGLIATRDYDAAASLLERARAIQEAHEDTESEGLAWRLGSEADILFAKGDYAEAEAGYRRALEVSKEELRARHPLVAYRLEDLASALVERGSYDEALRVREQALDIVRSELRPTHPVHARIFGSMGYLHQTVGRTADSQESLEKAVELREAEPFTDELVIATVLVNLAAVDHYMGNTERAIERTQRALEMNEERHGPDDPELVVLLNNLAGYYMMSGAPDKSFPLMDRALEIQERDLGADHPDLAKVMINMGALYDAAGAHLNSQIFYTRALTLQYVKLGKEHPDVAVAMFSLANLVSKLGRVEEAVSLASRSLDMAEDTFAQGHPVFTGSLQGLSGFLAMQEHYVEADELQQQARDILVSKLGADHGRVAEIDAWLAQLNEHAAAAETSTIAESEAPPSYTVAFPTPPQHVEVDPGSEAQVLKKYVLEEDAESGTSLSAIHIAAFDNPAPVESLEEHAAGYLAQIKRTVPDAEIAPVAYPDWVVEPLREHEIPHISFIVRHREANQTGKRNIYDFLALFFKTPDHLWTVTWNAPIDVIESSMAVFGTFVSEIEFHESEDGEAVAAIANDASAGAPVPTMEELGQLLGKCIGTTQQLLKAQKEVTPMVCMLQPDGSVTTIVLFMEAASSDDMLRSFLDGFGASDDDARAIAVAVPDRTTLADGSPTEAARFHLESRGGYCRDVWLPYKVKGKKKKAKVEIGEIFEEPAECSGWNAP